MKKILEGGGGKVKTVKSKHNSQEHLSA